MNIDADFESGSVDVLSVRGDSAELALRADTNASFRQWFAFRARGVRGRALDLVIANAGEATYPDAFEGYRVVASYDQRRWFRVPTEFDGEALRVAHRAHADVVHYAYFAPYTVARRERVLRSAARAPWVRAETLGRSVDGRELRALVFGDDDGAKRRVWITARQHPGETMAEWFAEGLIERLLDDEDPVTRAVLSRAVVHVVPCVNPDGGVRGNLRANAAGQDLNRAWLAPDREVHPEVAAVRDRMHATGVDLYLDIHGDERNPYCFLAGCEGNPGYSPRLQYLENLFEQSLLAANGDFQDEYGYERDAPGAGDLRAANNYVGEAFDCLSFTLEMPFKDNANAPDETAGWSPERAAHLGHSTLESIAACLHAVRGEVPDLDDERGDDEGDGAGDEDSDE